MKFLWFYVNEPRVVKVHMYQRGSDTDLLLEKGTGKVTIRTVYVVPLPNGLPLIKDGS